MLDFTEGNNGHVCILCVLTLMLLLMNYKCMIRKMDNTNILNGAVLGGGAMALLGVAGFYLNTSNYIPLDHDATTKLSNQSIEVEPGLRKSHFSQDGKLLNSIHGCTTSHEAFLRGMEVSENGPCVGKRSGNTYEFLQYKQVYDRAQRIGSALLKKGISPTEDGIVGIYAANSIEWILMEQACAMFSMVVVPLYDTLGADAVTFVMKRTNMSLVLVDTVKKANEVLNALTAASQLKTIVLTCSVPADLKQQADENKINIISLESMETFGLANLHDPIPPKPETVLTICFTSGTTGDPKGVVLTHKNIVSVAGSIDLCIQPSLKPSDTHFSFLPLAHVFERLMHVLIFTKGAKMGFMGGNVREMLKDMKALKPTLFVTVPRILNRFYDKAIQGAAANRFTSALYNFAYNRKMALLQQGIVTRESVWDRLVFNKIQDSLGGRVRIMVCGSAPLAKEVLDFVRCAFGCQIWEGYGQSETCGGASVTLAHELQGGHIGPPLPCLMVKMIDVPEMNYYVKDNRGEICIKGECVMREYYKDPEKTAETIDEDGWLLTGDVGKWTPNGCLQIVDRRKNIFKLAQGEYVAPDKVEIEYMNCPLISQIFVDGDSLKTYVVAVVVPDPEAILPWATYMGMNADFDTLCNGKALKTELLKQMSKIGKDSGLKSFEQIKDIYVCSKPFTLEDGLLTPTFKTKRPALRQHFQQIINNLYTQNEAQL